MTKLRNRKFYFCILFLIIFVLSLFFVLHINSIEKHANTLTLVPLHFDGDSAAWIAMDEKIGVSYLFDIDSDKSLDFSYSASDSNVSKSYHFTNIPLLTNHADLESENFQRKLWIWCIKNIPSHPDQIYPILKNPPSMGPAKNLSEVLCDLAAEQLNLPYRWHNHRWIAIQ